MTTRICRPSIPNCGHFCDAFAGSKPLFRTFDNSGRFPPVESPEAASILWIGNVFGDFRRHDLGPKFYKHN
jgi:hypothetical protein